MNEPTALYQHFLNELSPGFSGDICTGLADRLSMATDNSVYQQLPQAVLYPKHQQDVINLLSLMQAPLFHKISLAPRAGGTGTNGQSLTPGIVVNFTKYMNRIIDINFAEKIATVEPGVVLDQLNDALKNQGYFFAPHLSPSNRATLGGMVSTDASGKGSCHYGKTSQHIHTLTVIFEDGTEHLCKPYSKDVWQQFENPHLKARYQVIYDMVHQHQSEIATHYPKLVRYLTGFDLVHVCDKDGTIDLSRLIAGSEGSLAVITQIQLKLTPIPSHQALAIVMYDDLQSALIAAQGLLQTNPLAIETIDHTIMSLATTLIDTMSLRHCFTTKDNSLAKVVHFVEYAHADANNLATQLKNFNTYIKTQHACVRGLFITTNPQEMQSLWSIRAKSVEFLGKLPGLRKPVSGIEDTLVAPENLAEYVLALQKILDKHQLTYALYGHVDVGCIHVRPALNLQSNTDEAIYLEISTEVEALVRQYGGIFWGEHGKGFRSQYLKNILGEALYYACRHIKKNFDKHNQLNPGKLFIAAGSSMPVVRIDATTRGHYDKEITPVRQKDYKSALQCNGNGLCFHYNPNHLMCPSYKVTRDPVHSPNGRANALREWLRLKSLKKTSTGSNDYSHEVYQALHGCLGCHGCESQCPVSVSIPDMKSKFLFEYHQRYKRSIRDYLIGYSEHLANWQRNWPRITMKKKNLIAKIMLWFGLKDMPVLSTPTLKQQIPSHVLLTTPQLKNIKETKPFVLLLCDQLNAAYDVKVIDGMYQCAKALGVPIFLWDNIKSGRPLQVLGFLKSFEKLKQKNQAAIGNLLQQSVTLVGVDPSISAIYRQYELFETTNHRVLLFQEWLHQTLMQLPKKELHSDKIYYLFSHCTELSTLPQHDKLWIESFSHLGLTLTPLSLGCCGMAGSYGHEIEHVTNSHELFKMSWQKAIEEKNISPDQMLVTGYSCREQIRRLLSIEPQHPAHVIAKLL